MKRVQLNHEVELSCIVQGYWRLASWKRSSKENERFLEEGLDLGVTSLDTAEIYDRGESERQLGEVFGRRPELRRRVEIVTKTGIFSVERPQGRFSYYDTSYERILQSCEESLRRLQTNYIDLYLIHREDPMIDFEATAAALERLLKEGKIRAAGVSNFDPMKFRGLQEAMEGKLVTNQIELHPLCFEHFHSGMVDDLSRRKIHPMVWSPLAGGRLFHPATPEEILLSRRLERLAKELGLSLSTLVYAWILAHPVGALPISGSGSADRLREAVKALEVELPRPIWYEIYVASGQEVLR